MRNVDAAFPFISTDTTVLIWSGDVAGLVASLHPNRKQLADAILGWKRRRGRTWPVIPLRGAVLFPGTTMSFDIGREASLRALGDAAAADRELFVTAQIDPADEEPGEDGLYRFGCLAKIRQVMELRDDSNITIQKVLLVGLKRARIVEFKKGSRRAYHEVSLQLLDSKPAASDDLEAKAAYRLMLKSYERLAQISGRIPPERLTLIAQRSDWGQAADEVVSTTFLRFEPSQVILETVDVKERLHKVVQILQEENQVLEFERALDMKVRGKIDRNQHEYFLREQLRAIQEELGEQDSQLSDEAQLLQKLDASLMPDEIKNKVRKEIERFARIAPGSPEATVQRNWLETLVELPFGRTDKEKHNLSRARRILARDHYGLVKVKERIMEYLAVRKLGSSDGHPMKSPILCFIGPPGVGKTSIAKSIAEALGRRYIRMSLGGIRDEAEIRGHRRTYIGAMPGRIMQGIRQVDTDNPLFLLDEIDKLGNDFRGDPSSALLEVLDPEQNTSFRDHYLEVPYDLSNVLFIMTANTYDTIPEALLDRMEIIEVSGYTEEEKIEIGKRHLLPKQISRHALKPGQIKVSRPAMARLISWYTREAGVRQLERELAHLCRRAAIEIAEKKRDGLDVTPGSLETILGPRKFTFDMADKIDRVGIATGLAWTWSGGDTLTIEVNVLPGDGKLELTGQLGDVMKESARAALTYIRSRAGSLGLTVEDTHNKDIHIHVPAGATPKDGPSAGITLATALASALTGRAVRHDLAMTGEITLRGRILPIGGLKEKTVAANRAGISTVLIPQDNVRDLVEIADSVKKRLTIIPVEHMDEVLKHALMPENSKQQARQKAAVKNEGK